MKNTYVINGCTALVSTTNRKGITKVFQVDTKDLPKMKYCTWRVQIQPNGYEIVKGLRGVILARLITGCPEGLVVDHIDHNTLNNRRSNLRVVNKQENARHLSKPPRNNTSGMPGVSYATQYSMWRVALQVNGTKLYMGMYGNRIEACRVCNVARIKYYGSINAIRVPIKLTD